MPVIDCRFCGFLSGVYAQSGHVQSLSRWTAPSLVGQRRHYSEAEQDLVVIGSGPGGYVAAIKAAQLGMKVPSTCRVV